MFQNFKQSKADVFRGKIERSYISPMSLEIKKQKAIRYF